jgi:hypothetical protein
MKKKGLLAKYWAQRSCGMGARDGMGRAGSICCFLRDILLYSNISYSEVKEIVRKDAAVSRNGN